MSTSQHKRSGDPRPARVMVVDDSVVTRMVVRNAIERAEDLEIAAIAGSGISALKKLEQVRADVVVLDVEMPEMDGLETLVKIQRRYPRLPVVMFSGQTTHAASVTLEALFRGATDCVAKPAAVGTRAAALAYVERVLIPKLRELGATPVRPSASTEPFAREASTVRINARPLMDRPAPRGVIVGIGSSTGGPNALAALLSAMSRPIGGPVLICQHMPPSFTPLLAARLARRTGLDVAEARDGELIVPEMVRVAPGGRHLSVEETARGPVTRLEGGPPVNGCKPSVDVLFRSMAAIYGANMTAVVLTGMGTDGADGACHVQEHGGQVVVQDKESSVVWGMPGAVVRQGFANAVLPLEELGAWIGSTLSTRVRREDGGNV